MRHVKMVEWDRTLKNLFDEIDDILEDRYGHLFELHPSRPERGLTAGRDMDGLFNVGADFSGGYGSRLGRGYVINIHMSTLETVPPDIKTQIEEDVALLVSQKLPDKFPGRNLRVERDGTQLKIVGDMSLGSVIRA